MNSFFSKMRSSAGETLVEALAAVLVFTLSAILLFTMVNAASRINKEALASDLAVSSEVRYAEQKKAVSATGTVKLTFGKDSGKISGDVFGYPVDIFRESSGALYSFSLSS